MISLTMQYLLRNLEIELDPPTFPSFNDKGIIYCYIKCIRDEHNNFAIFIISPPHFLGLRFTTDHTEPCFLSFLSDTVSLCLYTDFPGHDASSESMLAEPVWKAL